MKLIVGLGNPGKKYLNTRHNIGFAILDELQKNNEFPQWKKSIRFKAEYCQGEILAEKIVLAKPITFMNNSGRAVISLARYYKIKPSDIWVIHDEIDLPLGKIRITQKASAAGHNGIKSIINDLKTNEFVRLRVGIFSDQQREKSAGKFVLQKFTKEENLKIPEIIKFSLLAINSALIDGITVAKNEYN